MAVERTPDSIHSSYTTYTPRPAAYGYVQTLALKTARHQHICSEPPKELLKL